MKSRLLAAGVVAALAAPWLMGALAVAATAADIDFSDFDDALMGDMDDAVKELDSNVAGQDAAASLANVAVLRDGLVWVEKYFVAKAEAPLGAGFAREGLENIAALEKALQSGDFDGAQSGVRGVVKSCKVCHEAYRPPEL
jgi:cytochrome c556